MKFIRTIFVRYRDDALLLAITTIGLIVVVLCGIFVTPRVISFMKASPEAEGEADLAAASAPESLGTGIANLPAQKVVLGNGQSYLEFQLAVEYDRDAFWADSLRAPDGAKELEAQKFRSLEPMIRDSINTELSGSNPQLFFGTSGMHELKWALNDAIGTVVGRNTVRDVYFQRLYRWPPEDDE